jgi:hypothetical protein
MGKKKNKTQVFVSYSSRKDELGSKLTKTGAQAVVLVLRARVRR